MRVSSLAMKSTARNVSKRAQRNIPEIADWGCHKVEGCRCCYHGRGMIYHAPTMVQLRSQRSLGAGHILPSRINLRRGIQRTRQRLKEGLYFMMIVASIQYLGVQIHPCVEGNALKEVKDEIRA